MYPTLAAILLCCFNAAGTRQTTVTYDPEDRLTSFNRNNGDSQTWNLSLVGDWNTFNANGTAQTRTHNSVHALTAINGTALTYDVKGNLTQNTAGQGFVWDYENRMSSANSGATTLGTYKYDALGRRVSKVAGATTTVFVNDGLQEICEYDNGAAVGSPSRSYVFGSYIDEPLMMVNAGVKSYYHTNNLYSVAALTNAAGAVVERYTYDPYGKVKILAPDGVTVRTASSVGNPWYFTGRRLDSETGLMYYRARYYDVGLGRFISRDPIGYKGSKWNLYAYVSDKPTCYIDPKGHHLTIPWDSEHAYFIGLLNQLCPEGKWAVGYWDDQVYSTVPDFCEPRIDANWIPPDATIPECYRDSGWNSSGHWQYTTINRGCASSAHPNSCCCICDAINKGMTIELQRKTGAGASGEGGLTNDFGSVPHVIDVVITVGAGRTGDYPGYGDTTQPAGSTRVTSNSMIILGHELCSHAVPEGGNPHDDKSPDYYTVKDPSVMIENAIRGEHGMGTRTGMK